MIARVQTGNIRLIEAKMIDLTEAQIHAMDDSHDEPIRVRHPRTNETFVLIRDASFERLKSLLDLSEYNPDEGLAHLDEVMADDDKDDPLLAGYQRYARSK